jgi:hypothetical protein
LKFVSLKQAQLVFQILMRVLLPDQNLDFTSMFAQLGGI